MGELKNGIKTFYTPSRKKWRSWLQKNHVKEKSVWLIIYHKKSTSTGVYYQEVYFKNQLAENSFLSYNYSTDFIFLASFKLSTLL